MTVTATHLPRHRHSPRVRRLAREAGIDPGDVMGTGPNGRVRPADIAAAASVTEPGPPVASYLADLDLSAIPNAHADRLAVVGAVAYALLRAVRRYHPIVTDIEVVSEAGETLIQGAHNLTVGAIIDRLQLAADVQRSSAASTITITDQPALGGVLRVGPPQPDRLLNALIGPTTVRPATHPGPAGLPTIEFRPSALLAIATGAEFDDSTATAIMEFLMRSI